MEAWVTNIVEAMFRYIGQTVTIFTTSGGLSGSGFTGVLLSADCHVVRLLADVGAAPACPIGSDCTCGPVGQNCGYGFGCGSFNPLGAICVIPAAHTDCTRVNLQTVHTRLCTDRKYHRRSNTRLTTGI